MNHTSLRVTLTSLLFVFAIPMWAHAAPSLSISALSPAGGSVPVNTPVSFTVVPTELSSPTYTITDDVGVNLSSNLNPFGQFVWTPYTRDAGTHNITITATDGAGQSASVSQTITVINPSATLDNLVAPTHPGVLSTFQVNPVGFVSPTYALLDTFSGTTLTNQKLSAGGAFSWVPTMSDIGTHKVTIFVSDSVGHYVELNQTFVVAPAPIPQVESLVPGPSVPPGTTVTFKVSSPGYTSPTFSVFDSYTPSTVNSSHISTDGVFTWTPTLSQAGVHNIRVRVVGSDGRSTDVTQVMTVETPVLSIEGFKGDGTVPVGSTVTFTVAWKGLTNPTFTTSNNRPGGSTVLKDSTSASGLFAWVPTMGDLGLHNISIYAADELGNTATVRKDIRVVEEVRPLSPSSSSSATTVPTSTVSTTVVVTPTSVQITPPQGATTGYVFTKALKIGSTGTEVRELQKLLKSLGMLSAEPSGTFGPLTGAAVKKFQKFHGLEQVGSVGPGTRAKLNAKSVSSANRAGYIFTKPLAVGATGEEVVQLQQRLGILGLYLGTPSGVFDSATLEAVKAYQSLRGLERVGSVGPATRKALNAE